MFRFSTLFTQGINLIDNFGHMSNGIIENLYIDNLNSLDTFSNGTNFYIFCVTKYMNHVHSTNCPKKFYSLYNTA